MRLHFPNLERPKKAAKRLSARLNVQLSICQESIAKALGYLDWFDLTRNISIQAPSPLDQVLARTDFVCRQVEIINRLAEILNKPEGDIQYAVLGSRLTGDLPATIGDHRDIRLACLRKSALPMSSRRNKGSIGYIQSKGFSRDPVILRNFGRPTVVVAQKDITWVADFEYKHFTSCQNIFIPMRLYLPYGVWTEEDGAQVLFSRDYKPMWRLRDGAEPERMEPDVWVKYVRQEHIWSGFPAPWEEPKLKNKLEEFLSLRGVHALPVWADALPIIVNDETVDRFAGALKPLMLERVAS